MKKLYTLTNSNFILLYALSPSGDYQCLPADNIPMLHWPNGSWCYEANIYMLEKYKKGRSRKFNGGSLFTYATQLSHLIRYCYYNNVGFSHISDTHFKAFINFLRGERNNSNLQQKKRTDDTVISIGRRALDFLEVVSNIHGVDNLIGPSGQIKAEKREFRFFSENSKSVHSRNYWHHYSFPTPSGNKKRDPITSTAIQSLKQTVLSASGSSFIRKRRYVLLRLLEITGGRRTEVCYITTKSVFDALSMEQPALTLITLKQGGQALPSRTIFISRHDAEYLKEYIEKNRSVIIQKTLGRQNDHGFLLISETTGKQLKPNTITQELQALRAASGLQTKAHPHMFRHRFITKQFIALIQQNEFRSPDDFRRRLIDVEGFKRKIMELTGHKSIRSLDRYIDCAFDEYYEADKIRSLLESLRDVDGLKNRLLDIAASVESGVPANIVLSKIFNIVQTFDADLKK